MILIMNFQDLIQLKYDIKKFRERNETEDYKTLFFGLQWIWRYFYENKNSEKKLRI